LVSGPAALDREDAMDVGREVGHVDRGGESEIWVEGFEGGEGAGDPGLAGLALPSDPFHELASVGIGLGRRGQDVHDARGVPALSPDRAVPRYGNAGLDDVH
jgi:hypothetical protein